MENNKSPLPIALAVISSLLILGSILSLFIISRIAPLASQDFNSAILNPVWISVGYFACVSLIALGWAQRKTLTWYAGVGWIISVLFAHVLTIFVGNESFKTLTVKFAITIILLAYLNSEKVRIYLGTEKKLERKNIIRIAIFALSFILVTIRLQLNS